MESTQMTRRDNLFRTTFLKYTHDNLLITDDQGCCGKSSFSKPKPNFYWLFFKDDDPKNTMVLSKFP